MKIPGTLALVMALTTTLASGGFAAHPYVYPAKGQSQERQQKDMYECHEWAVKQSGFDPSQPVEESTPRHGLLGGAARGAALGAVGGAIGGDAGKGAAAGAAVGGLVSIMRNRQENKAQQQQYNANTQSYDRAYDACLRGRGYSIG